MTRERILTEERVNASVFHTALLDLSQLLYERTDGKVQATLRVRRPSHAVPYKMRVFAEADSLPRGPAIAHVSASSSQSRTLLIEGRGYADTILTQIGAMSAVWPFRIQSYRAMNRMSPVSSYASMVVDYCTEPDGPCLEAGR